MKLEHIVLAHDVTPHLLDSECIVPWSTTPPMERGEGLYKQMNHLLPKIWKRTDCLTIR